MALEAWRRVRLGEVLTPISRHRPVEPDRSYSLLGVRWYGNGCHLHDTIHGSKLKTSTLNAVDIGDVTYNKMWVSKGAFAVVDERHRGLFATNEYPTFQATTDLAFPPFLRCAFKDPGFVAQARESCRGTTSRARLNPKDFLELPVALPPLGEQCKIAAILSSVDDAIEAAQIVIEQLQVVKRATMAELLTRGPPGRHSRFRQTDVGEVPEDWKPCTIGELVDFSGGSQPSKENFVAERRDGYVRLIQIRDYKTDRYATYVPRHLVRKFCDSSDVMIGRYGPPIFQILRGIDGAYNVALIKATPDEGRLSKSYLFYYLQVESLFDLIERLSQRTSGQTGIDLDALRAYPLPLPPKEQQEEIVACIDTIQQRQERERSYSAGLASWKVALMSVLLTGEVRVTPDEAWS